MSISSAAGPRRSRPALKMARQYFVEIGQPERRHFNRPQAELITATRWARWLSAAMSGGADSSGRCSSKRITFRPVSIIAGGCCPGRHRKPMEKGSRPSWTPRLPNLGRKR